MSVKESAIQDFVGHTQSARQAIFRPIRVSFEHGIIAFGVGIAVYFSWPTEPVLWAVAVVALIACLLATLSPTSVQQYGLLSAVCVLGFAWSFTLTHTVGANPLEREMRLTVSGLVVAEDTGGRMRRVYIAPDTLDPMPRRGAPKLLRIRVGKGLAEMRVGDTVLIDVVAGPLPGPAIPNGYDPARRAYFDGIGGTGFAISQFERLPNSSSLKTRLGSQLFQIRNSISERVIKSAPEQTAGLQAALLTGLRDAIPDAQTDALRASGLAHILAISGLHMGMVSFGVFAVVSTLLSLIERFARERDVRKYAAVISLVAATLYLGLSGASVATQRAYIMVTIAFLAIILDRRAISLRSVAVAALITLVIRPEALLSVGFQMSFAAVTAMVVIFRAWQDRRPPKRARSLRERVQSFYASLFGTSVVAGFATGGFALLHFGRIAKYGLVGNMAAMVVFPLVMALGIVALLLMPLGLEAAPLWLMSKTLIFMLEVADRVSALPGAVSTVKAAQPLVIALYGLGFAVACLGSLRSLSVGNALMGAAIMIWMSAPSYDMRINPDGRISVLMENAGFTTSLRADRYGRDQFSRADGQTDVEWSDYRKSVADCDALACRFEHKGKFVSVVNAPSEVRLACEDSDLVVLVDRSAGPVARRGCSALLLDTDDLAKMGGVHVALGDTISLTPVVSERRRRRPWG